jgi:hypothetical protein
MINLEHLAQQLCQDSQILRIKKLLLYAARGQWSSDPIGLQNLDLLPILAALQDQRPSLDDLKLHLQSILPQLSKPAEYGQIVELILAHWAIYDALDGPDSVSTLPETAAVDVPAEPVAAAAPETVVVTMLVGSGPARTPSFQPNPLFARQSQIAQDWDQHPDRRRLVKFLLYLTRQIWEADADRLAQVELGPLVADTWRVYATRADLQRGIVGLTQRLNKPEYGPIGALIEAELGALYQALTIQGAAAALPAPVLTVTGPSTSPSTGPSTGPSIGQSTGQGEPIDPFDLRLEVIKFTNPLRAKILLYALLQQPFDDSPAAHSALQRYSLGGLLGQLQERYRPSEMAVALEQAAQRGGEDYAAVADALIRALKVPLSAVSVRAGWTPIGVALDPAADPLTQLHTQLAPQRATEMATCPEGRDY